MANHFVTNRAGKVMALANQEAQRFNHEYIGTEHILLGLIGEGTGATAHVLRGAAIDLRRARLEVEKLVRPGSEIVYQAKLPQTPSAKRVLEPAIAEANGLHSDQVDAEHLLLGLLREQGVAFQILVNLGLTPDKVRRELRQPLGGDPDHQSPTLPSG